MDVLLVKKISVAVSIPDEKDFTRQIAWFADREGCAASA
jgi:hypothetical protein